MILWIASYPRSGNTMLRIILNQAFGLKSYSKYNDVNDIGASPQMIDLVGHKFLEHEWNKAYSKMQNSDELYLVKTHDPPENDSKAIYIVRDGRAATVSFFHYLMEYTDREHSLTELILGFVPLGSWSAHLDAWGPLNRPNTLLVKYEQLLSSPAIEIERLGDFLGQRYAAQWNNDFEYYHSISPKFFRSGDSLKNIKEIENNDLEFFWLFHGDWMNTLGYGSNDTRSITDRHALREASEGMYQKMQVNAFTLMKEKKALITERNRLNERIEKMSNTLSWRITAPLRDSELLKKLLVKLGKETR